MARETPPAGLSTKELKAAEESIFRMSRAKSVDKSSKSKGKKSKSKKEELDSSDSSD